MPTNLIKKDVIIALAASAAGLDNREGNPRLKQVINRLLIDLMIAIDELDISMDEFWTGVAYLTQAGKQNEFGLIVPGVVLEHFLDLRLDEAERRAGLAGGTARTIVFDPTQTAYNLRRRIETDRDGRYRFRSIMPSGYACPPDSQTEKLLQAMGRHGNRPAHCTSSSPPPATASSRPRSISRATSTCTTISPSAPATN